MHEGSGVCMVSDIKEMALSGKGTEKMYYSLTPVFTNGSSVITPVDSATTGKVRIRDIKEKEEIEGIISSLPTLPVIEEPDDKKRAECVKEEISKFDPVALASVVKTAYLRKKMRLANGKKVMSVDEKILQSVGKKLFQEMAFVLHEDLSKVESDFYSVLDV